MVQGGGSAQLQTIKEDSQGHNEMRRRVLLAGVQHISTVGLSGRTVYVLMR